MPTPFCGGAQSGSGLRRVLKEFQNSDAVTSGQGDAFMPRHDLLGSGQGSTQHKGREIQTFVRGSGSENALLFARGAELDTVVAGC
jgi:hypothetical protein